MNQWINKDTEIYCSFAETAGNTGCQMMNTSFYYYGLNKIYKSFSVSNIEEAVNAVKTLNIKGFAITMPYKTQVLNFVDECDDDEEDDEEDDGGDEEDMNDFIVQDEDGEFRF